MQQQLKKIALIAAYQPTDILLTLLQELREAEIEAIVVNDGSSPDRGELFETVATKAILLTHPHNRGKGCAIKTGLAYIVSDVLEPCTVVTLDADGQHRVEDGIKLLNAAEKTPDTLILGSRALQQNVPLRSKLGNTITRHVFRLSTGTKIHDTQTGLRAFSSKMIPALLPIEGDRYEYEMNVLLEMTRQQVPVQEIEIQTLYFDQNQGSHFNTVTDAYRIYKEIIKFSASSLCSFLLDYSVYSVMLLLTASMGASNAVMISNVVARVISATFNYNVNRKWVFRSQTGLKQSLPQYILLAVVILIANTVTLGLLVNVASMNQYTAKLLNELVFFVISWGVQRCLIFKKQDVTKQ